MRRFAPLAFVLLCAAPAFAKMQTGQVAVSTAAAIGTGNGTRTTLTIKNKNGSSACVFCGPATVTTSNGIEICAGQAFTWSSTDGSGVPDASDVIQCVAATGTQTVTYSETVQ